MPYPDVYIRKRYTYDGPVLAFDKIVANHWHGETYAVTEAKARSNLIYQFKKQYGYAPNARIDLLSRDSRGCPMVRTDDE